MGHLARTCASNCLVELGAEPSIRFSLSASKQPAPPALILMRKAAVRALWALRRRRASELERDVPARANHAGEQRSSRESAMPPRATIQNISPNCRDGPLPDSRSTSNGVHCVAIVSFDHLVDGGEQNCRGGVHGRRAGFSAARFPCGGTHFQSRDLSVDRPGSTDVRHVRRPFRLATPLRLRADRPVFRPAWAAPGERPCSPCCSACPVGDGACGWSTAATTGAPGAIVGGDGARRSDPAPSLSDDVDGAILWSGTAGPEGEAVKNDTPGDRLGASRADTAPSVWLETAGPRCATS